MVSLSECFRSGSFVALVLAMVGTAGCKGPPPTPCFPVAGKVSWQKKVLPSGIVTFVPDASKGNTSKENAIGMIGADGSYSLKTNGRDGAPLGWYKVGVDPRGMPIDVPPVGQPLPKAPAINAKYQKPDTSGISIEVTESAAKPGAYDIELK